MELNFNKEGNVWVAEFEATSDFNLHLERVDDGLIKVMQRGTTEGEYVDSFITSGDNQMKNFDCDFAALVYPKYIKVISGTEVVSASVNFNEGGGLGSDGVKWEYYKIELSDASYDVDAMWNVFSYVTLDNHKTDGIIIIGPKGQGWATTVAIAGISVKYMFHESVIDTGSWLSTIKECDKSFGLDYDYSFLKPITEEEFYSDNFDYPIGAEPN